MFTGCGKECSLQTFISVTKHYVIYDRKKECRNTEASIPGYGNSEYFVVLYINYVFEMSD